MVQISDLSCVICNTTYINVYYTMYSEHIFTQLGSNDLSSVDARAGWTGAMCSCLCGWVIGSCTLGNIHLTSSTYLSESKNIFVWSDQFISSNFKMHFCIRLSAWVHSAVDIGHPPPFPGGFQYRRSFCIFILSCVFSVLYFVFCIWSTEQ